MKKTDELCVSLTVLLLYVWYRVKSGFCYTPYPNLVKYPLAALLLLYCLKTRNMRGFSQRKRGEQVL